MNINEPGWLADMIATTVAPPIEERQDLLMTPDPLERLRCVVKLLAKEADVLELEDEIHSKARGNPKAR